MAVVDGLDPEAVFSQPHLTALMARVPTFMTLDDHEIEDNWPANASPRDFQVKYPSAMHAYSIYQMSHSLSGDVHSSM